jgi:uncharacterized membrane protein YdjX (TVP38/TMEM64 family)
MYGMQPSPSPLATPASDAAPPHSSRKRRWTRVLLALAGVVGVVLLGRFAAEFVPSFSGWVDRLGIWGPVAFVAGYAVACILFVPASLLTLAAGAIFGVALGVPLVLTGASLGATASFLIARYLAQDAVGRRLSRDPRLAAIGRLVGTDGRRIVFLMRLSPVFPFGALNYALGLTRLRLVDFLIALLGIIPGTALYVYSGAVAGAVVGAVGSTGPERGAAYYALLAIGLVATLVVTVMITRAARRALRDSRAATLHPASAPRAS